MRKLENEELPRLSVKEYKLAQKIPVKIILDNVRSQNNIGSVFRTADAFRVEELVLCGITATPPHREIHKTALGATESVDWQYQEDTLTVIRELREKGYTVYAVEQAEGARSPQKLDLDLKGRYALVLGHEIRGVSQEAVDLCDACIEIPQYGTKHSLNVAVAAGIVIWEMLRKLAPVLSSP